MTTTEEKKAYVRRSKQTRNHHCHYPGCGKQCKPAQWGCYSCWMKLPKFLRDKIWAVYRIGQEVNQSPSREYVTVMREVRLWISCGETGL